MIRLDERRIPLHVFHGLEDRLQRDLEVASDLFRRARLGAVDGVVHHVSADPPTLQEELAVI
jgi:hypothetical protein